MKFDNPLISTVDLADGSVTTPKLAALAVTTGKIGALAVTDSQLAAAAVTAGKIAAGAVTTPAIAGNAVGTSELALLSVVTDRLADSAVASSKLATNLQADNYVAGVDGWFIGRVTGSAEFNNIVIRGTIYANAGEIGTLDITGTLTMTGGGAIRTGVSGQRVEISQNQSDRIELYTGAAGETDPARIEISSTSLLVRSPSFGVGAAQMALQPSPSGSSLISFIVYGSAGSGYVFTTWSAAVGFTTAMSFSSTSAVITGKLTLSNGLVVAGDTFTERIQTGQTSFAATPWASSVIALGDYGSVGSQGSFANGFSWNWTRTAAGFVSLGVNGYTTAGSVEIGNTGILFRFQSAYAATGAPTLAGMVNAEQDWIFGSGGTGKAKIHDLANSNSFLTYSFDGDTDLGLARRGTNSMKFVAAGTDQMWVDSTGIYVRNLPSTGSASNTYLNGSGRIERSTSARRYKSRITYNVGYLADVDLRPTKFYRKDDHRWFYGLIADDLGDQDRLVGEYVDGVIDNYDTRAVIAILAAKANRWEETRVALADALVRIARLESVACQT